VEGFDVKESAPLQIIPHENKRGEIVSRNEQSDLQSYKDTLSELFREAKTPEERKQILEMREKVHEQERKDAELAYSRDCANAQLSEAQNQSNYSRGQQIVASTVAVGIGIYFMPSVPLVGTLFLIIGLTKPLGYSLSEVSKLLDRLQGLAGIPRDILSEENNKRQIEEGKNESSQVL